MVGATFTTDAGARTFRISCLVQGQGTAWFDEVHCKRGIDCLDSYQRRWDERRGDYSNEELSPFWANHGADAFMTGACGFLPPPAEQVVHRKARLGMVV